MLLINYSSNFNWFPELCFIPSIASIGQQCFGGRGLVQNCCKNLRSLCSWFPWARFFLDAAQLHLSVAPLLTCDYVLSVISLRTSVVGWTAYFLSVLHCGFASYRCVLCNVFRMGFTIGSQWRLFSCNISYVRTYYDGYLSQSSTAIAHDLDWLFSVFSYVYKVAGWSTRHVKRDDIELVANYSTSCSERHGWVRPLTHPWTRNAL
jgi:hypothetical protein